MDDRMHDVEGRWVIKTSKLTRLRMDTNVPVEQLSADSVVERSA